MNYASDLKQVTCILDSVITYRTVHNLKSNLFSSKTLLTYGIGLINEQKTSSFYSLTVCFTLFYHYVYCYVGLWLTVYRTHVIIKLQRPVRQMLQKKMLEKKKLCNLLFYKTWVTTFYKMWWPTFSNFKERFFYWFLLSYSATQTFTGSSQVVLLLLAGSSSMPYLLLILRHFINDLPTADSR